jgi:hypothetical protein
MARVQKTFCGVFEPPRSGASLRPALWIVPTPTPSSTAILFQPTPLGNKFHDVLQLTRLPTVFNVYDTQAEAIKSFETSSISATS